jgi:large subunit ribosomal protein L28
MARCELTGKGPVVKNLVSHSNIKTKTRNQPNVQSKKLYSRILNRQVTLKVATTTIRTLESQGGFDTFLLNAKDTQLSHRASAIKRMLRRKLTANVAQPEVAKSAGPKASTKTAKTTAAAAPKKARAAKKTK